MPGVAAMASFRMPAEWEAHRGTLLAWPHRGSDWPGKFAAIPWVYGEIVRTLARYEPVFIIIRDAKQKEAVKSILDRVHADATNIQFLTTPTNRGWMRDSGPIVVRDGQNCVALDW